MQGLLFSHIHIFPSPVPQPGQSYLYCALSFQQPLQRGHDSDVRVAGKLVGGGDAVGHPGKVHSGGKGCLGVNGAVADVEGAGTGGVQLVEGQQEAFGRGLGRLHVLAAHDEVQESVREVLVHEFLDAVAVFGGDDAYLRAAVSQGGEHGGGFGVEAGVGGHVHVGFADVLLAEGGQSAGVGDAGQQGERVFERLADGALDGVVGHGGEAVAVEHVAEAGDDAARGVGQRVVEVEEVGGVRLHGCASSSGCCALSSSCSSRISSSTARLK